MTTIHKTELFVARLLAVKGTKPDVYHKGLKRLKCLGNFVHNVESLRENKNDIVVVKRPSKVRNVNEYLPCIHCYGFYVVDELWKHTKQCDLQTVEKDVDVSCVIDQSQKVLNDSNIVQQSKFLLDSACVPDASTSSMSDQMRVLVNAMHEDELVRVVSKDKLLLLFGETLLNKYGPTKKNDIAQRLRQLARLLLKCRDNLSDDTLSYFDVLCGKMFDACIEGTFNLCGMNITNDGRREFQTPSLALRLGHLLKKLGAAKQGFCLRNDDLDGLKEAESFGKLLQSEWTDTVATNAHNTLKRRKDQSVQLLPITEDLRSLRTYQMKEMRQCIDSLQDSPDYSTWRKLAQLTMTRMTIFNKRRGGEVSKMLLETYKTRPDWKSLTNEEVMRSLQPMERTLLKRLDLVQIPGKKSRKVPMLITDDVKEGIDMLNLNRDAVGIPSTNPFCFASKSSSGHLDNWQAMNLISQEASVKHPELITSTKLRKYNATVSQLFDLNQGELEWLSNHMGHDLNIHKDFYRLHDSTIEMAKVSRLLMAVDSGKAAEFVGKKLTDINLNDFHLDGIENEDKERMKTYVADNETDPTANVCTENVSNSGDDQSELLDAQNSLLKGNRRSDIRNKITTNRVQKSDSESHGMELTKIGKRSASNGKGYHSAPRKRKIARYVSDSDSNSEDKRGTKSYSKQKSAWSHREIQILKTEFAHHLKQGIYPSGKQIHRAININTCLKNRTVLNVRAKLQHLMRKKV